MPKTKEGVRINRREAKWWKAITTGFRAEEELDFREKREWKRCLQTTKKQDGSLKRL
jgi:hypothetical protein